MTKNYRKLPVKFIDQRRRSKMIQIGRFRLKKERLILTLFAVPFILFVFAFSYVPLFVWILAFVNYKPGLNIWDCDFK